MYQCLRESLFSIVLGMNTKRSIVESYGNSVLKFLGGHSTLFQDSSLLMYTMHLALSADHMPNQKGTAEGRPSGPQSLDTPLPPVSVLNVFIGSLPSVTLHFHGELWAMLLDVCASGSLLPGSWGGGG